MEIPTFSTQSIAASDDFSNYQDPTFSEFALSSQVFSREVEEAANILCAMHTDQTKKHLQPPMEPVHNLFDTPRLEKRSIVIITSHTKEDQSPDFTVRRKYQSNDRPPSDTPGNERLSNQSILASGQSSGQHSSVADIPPNPCETSGPLPNSQNLAGPFFRPKVAVSTINPRLNIDQIQQNTSPAGNKLDFTTSASDPGQSLTISQDKTCQKAYAQSKKRKAYQKTYQKAYRESEKGKAYRKAYAQSEKRKAYLQAYRESEKGKAYRKAYAQSEKRKAYLQAYRKSEKHQAYQKAYAQSEKRKAAMRARAQSETGKAYSKAYRQSEQRKAYQKAYYKALKNTGVKEQARIAGKQASTFIRELNKAKNL